LNFYEEVAEVTLARTADTISIIDTKKRPKRTSYGVTNTIFIGLKLVSPPEA